MLTRRIFGNKLGQAKWGAHGVPPAGREQGTPPPGFGSDSERHLLFLKVEDVSSACLMSVGQMTYC